MFSKKKRKCLMKRKRRKTYEPKLENSRPGGRVVGANQKESLGRGMLCKPALLLSIEMVIAVVTETVLVGLDIPSITQEDKFGKRVRSRRSTRKHPHFLLNGLELEHF